VRREHVKISAPAAGGEGNLVVYGHYGRPVLVFPSEAGRAWDFENNGMVDAVRWLIDEGRIKLYCVDSHDGASWSAKDRPMEERARNHGAYESWITDNVAPAIFADCGGRTDIVTTGASAGAFHAVNFALKRADLFPLAIAMSGNYDPTTWSGWGEQGEQTYFNNPMAYVPNLAGDHLDWLRSRVFLVLVVGQGAWEVNPTKALPSTQQFAGLLRERGIPHDLDLWGFDVPHDWPSWQRQLAHHLPRFC
jgi:esterase/lipase superfamily enzyme